MAKALILMFIFVVSFISPSYGYDPLDPNGNITLKWDLLLGSESASDVKVSIFNYQQYRHVDAPGWKLNFNWTSKEVIWGIWGAQATEQGDCSAFKGSATLPHCCEKSPVIVDLLPGTPYSMQSQNCCKGGVLSSLKQDISTYGAMFQMSVGASANYTGFQMPENFSIGVPGYTCGQAFEVEPSRYSNDGGRRWTQVLRTWKVICMYSQFMLAKPKCCVSMSSFYNSTIVSCPRCSCGCRTQPGAECVEFGETPSLLEQKTDPNAEPRSLVRCTRHMCPIRVHWHVKESYKEYWRVKVTVTNFDILRNYSDWNLVVQHPNLRSLTQIFSFNYAPLTPYQTINDTGMFWGIEFYNDVLLQEGKTGNIQSEMLLHKDKGIFTFSEGWAFPRKILFNGDECVMPQPDDYPRLPNNGHASTISLFLVFFSFSLFHVL